MLMLIFPFFLMLGFVGVIVVFSFFILSVTGKIGWLQRRGVPSSSIALSALWLYFSFVFFFVAPTFSEVFRSFDAELPLLSKWVESAIQRNILGGISLAIAIFAVAKDGRWKRPGINRALAMLWFVVLGLLTVALYAPLLIGGGLAGNQR